MQELGRQNTARASQHLLIARCCTVGFSLLLTMILTRLIKPAELGNWFLIFSGAITVGTLIGMGLPFWVGREASSWRTTRNGSFSPLVAGASLRMLVIFLGAYCLNALVRTQARSIVPAFWLDFGSTILVIAGMAAPSALLCQVIRGMGRPVAGIWFEVMPTISLILCLLLWVATRSGAPSATDVGALYCIGLILAMTSCVFFLSNGRHCMGVSARPATDRGKRPLLSAAWPIGLNELVSRISAQMDLWIAAWYLSPQTVAIYGLATRAAMIALLMQNASRGLLQSDVPYLSTNNDPREMRKLVLRAAKANFLFSIAVVIGFAAAGQWAIEVAFGSDYTDAWDVCLILLTGRAIATFLGPNQLLLSLTGHQRQLLLLTATGILLLLPLLLLATSWFGVYGTATAIASFTICQSLATAIQARKHLGFWSCGWVGARSPPC